MKSKSDFFVYGSEFSKYNITKLYCLVAIEDLTTKLEDMRAETLNFWLSKFVQEVAKQNGVRYPPRSIYLIICGISRHLSEKNGSQAVEILNKNERRFVTIQYRNMLVIINETIH